jgi:hypothetical protein
MLTWEQFVEWKAFVHIEGPIGPGRDDLYAILQASKRDVTDVLPWLKEHVEDDGSDRGADMYIPTAEERAWVAALPD